MTLPPIPAVARALGHDRPGLAARATEAAMTIQRLRDKRRQIILAYLEHKSNARRARGHSRR